jgi:YD repeat-containing protein
VNVYDAFGRVTSQTDPAGYQTQVNYTGLNQTTGTGTVAATDPEGFVTDYTYTAGAVTAVVEGAGGSSPSETDYGPDLSTGTLLDQWTNDADGNETTMGYDANGNQISETDPLGNETTDRFTSTNLSICHTTAIGTQIGENCATLTPPAIVTAGQAITAPSTPPAGVTYSLVDTDGNVLYSTTGVYNPGTSTPYKSTADHQQKAYHLRNGNTVSGYGGCSVSAPSATLPCASIDPDGVETQLQYNSQGNLTYSSTPDGNGSEDATTTFVYDADGEMTSTVSPDGNLSGGNGGNYTISTYYNADGRIYETVVGNGSGHSVTPRETDYFYDGNGNQTSVEDPNRNTSYTQYTAGDQPTLETDADGNQTLTCWDSNGNQSISVPPIAVAYRGLGPSSCPTSYPSGYGNRLNATRAVTYTYDAQGDVTAETDPTPDSYYQYVTSTFQYDPAGNLIETQDPAPGYNSGSPEVTFDTYDADGNQLSETMGCIPSQTQSSCIATSGTITAASWSSANGGTETITASNSFYSGEVVELQNMNPSSFNGSVTMENPTSSSFQYAVSSSPGTLVSGGNAVPTSVSTTAGCFDPNGNQTATVSPNGNAGSLTGCETSYPWDATGSGNAYQTTDSFDSAGENVSEVGPATATAPNGTSSSSTFDAAGSITSATDPMGVVDTTSYTDDRAMSDTYSSGASITGAICSAGTATITAANGLVKGQSVTIAGNTSGYNGTYTVATASTSSFTYSLSCTGVGTNGGGTASPPLPHSVTYSYDADGSQAQTVDGTGTTTFTTDPFGEITSVKDPGSAPTQTCPDGTTSTTCYGYDADGNTTAVYYPLPAGSWHSQMYIGYSYDAAGQLYQMTNFNGHTVAVGSDADGNTTSITLGTSGDSTSITPDYTDSPSSISLMQGTTTLESFSLADSQSGDTLSETDTGTGQSANVSGCNGSTVTICNVADQESRLNTTTVSAASTSAGTAFNADQNGNPTTLPDRAASALYDKLDELTQSTQYGSTTTYNHDAAGDLISTTGGRNPISANMDAAGGLTAYNNTNVLPNAASITGAAYRAARRPSRPTIPFCRASRLPSPASRPAPSTAPSP